MQQEFIIKNLYKSYKDIKALSDVNITLKSGLYGLLGANGAGKSTLIKIIVGLEKQDDGSIEYLIDNKKAQILENIGYLPQYPMFYPDFTAGEFLDYMIRIKSPNDMKHRSKEEIDLLLDKVNLCEFKNKKVKEFSGGMKQRLGIAQALINNPNILIFDEATAGLDLKERIEFRNIISAISSDKIIIFATHIVSDVESIAKEIIFLDKGAVIDMATPNVLCSKLNAKVWNLNCHAEDIAKYTKEYIVSNINESNSEFSLRIISENKPMDKAIKAKPTLEDYCMYIYRSKE